MAQTWQDGQELIAIGKIRDAIVDVRSDLRYAKDELARLQRQVERQALPTLQGTEKDKSRAISWAIDDDEEYQAQLKVVRQLEKQEDWLDSRLNRALGPLRREEWLIRQGLADAALALASRPCMGVRDHALFDTLLESTGEDGVHLSDSGYQEEMALR